MELNKSVIACIYYFQCQPGNISRRLSNFKYNYSQLSMRTRLHGKPVRHQSSLSTDQDNKEDLHTHNQMALVSTIAKKVTTQNIPKIQKPLSSKEEINENDRKMSFAFYIFSKIHYTLRLRFDTMFLAMNMYKEYMKKPAKNPINYNYILASCVYLAMKFEEIYPPPLKEVSSFFKSTIQFQQYKKAQVEVLTKLNFNLKLDGPKVYLSKEWTDNGSEGRNHICYLVELAYADVSISKRYDTKQICAAVALLVSPLSDSFLRLQQIKGVPIKTVEACAKLLTMTRLKACQKYSFYFRKYQSSRFQGVSTRTFHFGGALPKTQ